MVKLTKRMKEIMEEHEIDDLKDFLYEKYIEDRLPTREISRILFGKDTSASTVKSWLKKFDIPVRQGSEAIKTQWENNPERRKAQSEFNKKTFTFEKRSETMKKTWENPEFRFMMTVGRTGKNNPMWNVTGEEHPNWNPELTMEYRIDVRKTTNDKRWRKAVFERDNYTCQTCGDNTGGNLVAHHKDGWNWCEERRYDTDNGVTLCEECHLDFHSIYGYGDNTEEQYEEYVKQLIKV